MGIANLHTHPLAGFAHQEFTSLSGVAVKEKMIYIPKNKEQIEKLLSEGISEAKESNEYCSGTKDGLTKGMGDDKRKSQLKNLQSGTEKILKALWLSRGNKIDKNNNRTLSLGDFISKLEKGDSEITKDEIDILKKINEANKIKHEVNYQLKEIGGVRELLDKLTRIINENKDSFIS